MPGTDVEPLEATIEIDAPPEAVWSLVSDLPRMAAWSPQVVRTFQFGSLGEGTRTLNVNRSGWKVWPTRSTVVRFDPPREIAFRVAENHTVWSFALDPAEDGGTRVTQRREAPDGIAGLSTRFVDLFLGGQQRFTDDLRAGMRQTLDRIKADAEN